MARVGLAAEGSRDGAFAPLDWLLTAGLAVTMGSSFFLIAVGVDDLAPPVVALGRLVLGAAALALVPAARRPLPRADLPRVGLLGLVWMAVPLMLFPLAERSVDSSLAGMVNASTPLFAALVAGITLRRAPGGAQTAGLVVGAAGVALLGAGGGGTPGGILMLLVAVAGYGLAVNLAVPLQQRHGALPVLVRAELAGAVVVAPFGLAGIPSSTFSWTALAAVATLGALGTGLAFAALALLVGRVGATRGSSVTYLLPVVALGLGAGVLDEPVRAPAIAGVALVLAGAALVSRPERRRRPGAAAGPAPAARRAAA